MPRKTDKNDPSWFDNQVIRAFRYTTQQERFQIAAAWCHDYYTPTAEAERIKVTPAALLVASLIDIEHPLLVSGRGVLYDLFICSVVLLQVELRKEAVSLPVGCTQPHVYSLCTDVDK